MQSTLIIPVARILLAVVFALSGWGKIMAFAALTQRFQAAGLPQAQILAVLAVVFELGGAVMLILGLWTRLGALMLIVFTIVATALFHDWWDPKHGAQKALQVIQFNKNLAIIGGLMLLAVTGGGALSVDAATRRR